MRASTGELDRARAEEPPRHLSVDAGERLERMKKHAAAMRAMFGEMAKAYVAIAPNLTAAQHLMAGERDVLSWNIVSSGEAREFFPAQPGTPRLPHRRGMAANCGPAGAESHPSALPSR